MSRATVIIPTFNHGPTLNYSVQSVLEQSEKDIEILIIGDGSPDITREIAADFERKDSRVKYFDFPKGPRHGEIYRHQVLKQATGDIVCYMTDDDMWMPNHVEYLLKLLEGEANFAHSLPVQILPSGTFSTWAIDFQEPYYRGLMLSGENRIPLACHAHKLDFYRRLPFGWRTTPGEIPTDLYMFQQFLMQKECKPVSGCKPTILKFEAKQRKDWNMDQRLGELSKWSKRMHQPGFDSWYEGRVMQALIRDQATLEARLATAIKQEHKEAKRIHKMFLDVEGNLKGLYDIYQEKHSALEMNSMRLAQITYERDKLEYEMQRLSHRFAKRSRKIIFRVPGIRKAWLTIKGQKT